MQGPEIVARRRNWSATDTAALLAEIEAGGGKVASLGGMGTRRDRTLTQMAKKWM